MTAAEDCGPGCFSFDGLQFRWVGDKWLSPEGLWTVDGITFTNPAGRTSTRS
ncbi:hypothetical protein [Mycolicibacterium brumae]|uniref:hypothetical protein n=1 Tax=Mycolicibacterium brumae TaxID=85968 RepID=UPI000A67A1A7|nr:hypothetical protein [Mycolicibacterium brumae]MCV7192694.1 hypothetical protein [Mycolicibacterium brumae]RWA23280.1 hypothetical protein MBRU_00240 [Mycolicibacterium brumae DSM 44177]UWW08792.1 hypothetical protein L2Z93_001858 [Mycolicibacterium brumae]